MSHKKYIVLGQGSVGRNFSRYFQKFENIQVESVSFREFLANAELCLNAWANEECVVVLCTRDSDSLQFCDLMKNTKLKVLSFSASFENSKVFRFHPLMTFPRNHFLSHELMQEIPFIGPHPESEFRQNLGFLKNSYYPLPAEFMLEYHARAFMACGLGGYLWKSFKDYLKNLNIPENAFLPILRASMNNLENLENPLSGPLEREEWALLEKYKNNLKRGTENKSNAFLVSLLEGIKNHEHR